VVIIATDGFYRHEAFFLLDLVQQAARCGVPVLNHSIAVGSQDYILSHTRSSKGSPPNHLSGHSILHVLVEDIALLTSEHIEDADGSVSTSSSNILVMPVKAHAESRDIDVTKNVLGRDFQVRLWVRLDCEMRGELWKIFSLFIFQFVKHCI